MINKRLKAFLNKELDDSDDLKQYSAKSLIKEIKKMSKGYEWKYKPWKHQAASIFLGLCYDGFGFYIDMGGGKTAITTSIIDVRRHLGEIDKKTLVVCPKMVIGSWIKEIPKFSNMRCEMLKKGFEDNWKTIKSTDAEVVCCSYGTLIALLCPLVKRRGSKTRRRVLDEKLLLDLSEHIDCLVMDESQAVKNRSSITTQAVGRLAATVKYRYGLTGTPMNSPVDIWSQYYMLDMGYTFGVNITMFRNAFFRKVKNPFGGMDFFLKSGMEAHLNRRIRNRAIRYESSEFENLPDRVDSIISLPFEPRAKKEYDKIIEAARSEEDSKKLENKFIRLRQLCSGFIDSKQNGEKLRIVFGQSAKIEWLTSFIDGLRKNQKLVIFTEFNETQNIISSALKKEKVKHVILKKPDDVDRFIEDNKCTALITNSRSGGAGLNLQCAQFVVFFESPVSVIVRKQAEKRVHRSGQTKTVYHYDLQVKDSIEERITDGLKKNINILDAILDGSEKL